MLGNKDGVANIAVRAWRPLLNVYRSKYAGTNKATAVTWVVGDDVEGAVRALKAKVKDPDGNILNIVSG